MGILRLLGRNLDEVVVEVTPAVVVVVLVVMEFCLDRESGLEELERKGEGGVEGVEEVFGEMPNSCLALTTTEWRRFSGPNANLIISFSPWSWISNKPMIFDAFSGSKLWILENTTFVASYASILSFLGC